MGRVFRDDSVACSGHGGCPQAEQRAGLDRMDERAVAALESLYSGPIKARELVRAREIFAFLRSNGQVRHHPAVPDDLPLCLRS